MSDVPNPIGRRERDNDHPLPPSLVTTHQLAAEYPASCLTADSMPLTAFPKLITSDELFGAERQILIDHAGAVYRLQITKQGKLILTK